MKKSVWFVVGCVLILSLASSGRMAGAQEPDPPTAPPPRPPLPLDGVPDPAFYLDSAPDLGQEGPLFPPAPEMRETAQQGDLVLWSRLAFQSARDGNWEIYVANGEGSNAARLTRTPASDVSPRLNRGSKWIVFASNRDGQYELYRMNVDGTGLLRLTDSLKDDVNPAWSPDGARIAFQSYRDGQAEIYVMNADGSGQTRLTSDAEFDATPAWSPDGTRIAFVSRRTGGYRIWVMNADGSEQRQLSDQPYSENPAWSPDGKRIAYDANADGDVWQDLWLMDADGSNQRQVFTLGNNQDVWVRSWSPDGTFVAYSCAQWYLYKGNWYLIASQMNYWAPGGGGYFNQATKKDMHPDWQTVDVQSPWALLDPLPPYARTADGVRLHWFGEDAGGSWLKSYDVQVQTLPDTRWLNWLEDTEDEYATLVGAAGSRYRFRVRARDNAYNLGHWTYPTETDEVTFYTWAVSGTARDARDAPLSGVVARTDQPAFLSFPSDLAGEYRAYVVRQASTYSVSWSKPGYGGLPTMTLNGAADAEFVDVVLPAADNAVSNWGFERGVLDGADWVPGGVVSPALAAENTHTGRYAARLGTPSSVGTDLAKGIEYAYLAQPAADAQGTLHAVLTGRRQGRPQIVYRQRPQGGTWTEPVNAFSPALDAHAVDLAADREGRVHVVWSSDMPDQGPEILYTVRDLAGNWSTPVNVSRSARASSEPQIALAKDGSVHVVWKQERDDAYEVYYARRGSGGAWSGAVKLSDHSEPVTGLEILPDGSGAVHVAWVSGGLTYARRDAAGTWSAPLSLSTGWWNMVVRLGVDDGNALHVMWNREGGVWYTRRNADGTWIDPVNLDPSGQREWPALVVTGSGALHAAWQRYGPDDNWEITYAQKPAGGDWSQPENVSNDPAYSMYPRLALDGTGVLHLLWQDNTRQEIAYAWRGTDGSWAARQNLSHSNASDSGLYLIVGRQTDVHAVWYAYVEGHTAVLHTAPSRVAHEGDSTLSQRVQIPPKMTHPTLSVWYSYGSNAPASTHWFGVELDDGSQVHPLFSEAENWYRWQRRWFDVSAWAGQTVTLTLRVHRSPGDPRAWAYVDEVSLASVTPDLWVEQTSAPTAAIPGQTIVHTLTYGNRGSTAAQDARLTETLPDGLAYVDAEPAPTTIDGATLTWEVGELAGYSGPYAIVLTTRVAPGTPFGQSLAAQVEISSATPEAASENNTAGSEIWVGGRLYLPITIKE